MCQFLHPLKSSNFDPRTYLRHLWVNISKKIFGSPGTLVSEILTSKILKMLIFRPKKNQCSRTNFIKICDACDLKKTQILHFYDKIFGTFVNKVVLQLYTLAW